MPAPSKVEKRQQKLLELRAENDILRETLVLQFEELEPVTLMVERGYSIATLAWQNRALFSHALSFFSRRKSRASTATETVPPIL